MIILSDSPVAPPKVGSFISKIHSTPTQAAIPTYQELVNTPTNIKNKIELMNVQDSRISYSYNKEIDMVIISIHSSDGDSIVRQIPSKDFVDMKISIQKHIGKILDIIVK